MFKVNFAMFCLAISCIAIANQVSEAKPQGGFAYSSPGGSGFGFGGNFPANGGPGYGHVAQSVNGYGSQGTGQINPSAFFSSGLPGAEFANPANYGFGRR